MLNFLIAVTTLIVTILNTNGSLAAGVTVSFAFESAPTSVIATCLTDARGQCALSVPTTDQPGLRRGAVTISVPDMTPKRVTRSVIWPSTLSNLNVNLTIDDTGQLVIPYELPYIQPAGTLDAAPPPTARVVVATHTPRPAFDPTAQAISTATPLTPPVVIPGIGVITPTPTLPLSTDQPVVWLIILAEIASAGAVALVLVRRRVRNRRVILLVLALGLVVALAASLLAMGGGQP